MRALPFTNRTVMAAGVEALRLGGAAEQRIHFTLAHPLVYQQIVVLRYARARREQQ